MKKTHYLVATLAILLVVAISLIMNYKFNNPKDNQYPPSIDFKQSVNKALDELLPDKIFDSVWKKIFHYLTTFESFDGFTLSGVPTIDGTGITLTTTGDDENEIQVTKQPAWQGLITFSQQSYFKTAVSLSQVTNQEIYITVGNKDTTHYYGFKIIDANLYGITYDGTTENAVLLQTVTATTYNLEARYSPSDKVIFLVESVEKGVSASNLPSPAETANVQLMDTRIKAKEAEVKVIQLSFFEYLQKRDILQ